MTKVSHIIEYFDGISDDILKKIFIFDFYKNIKSNSVKIGYRFVFQSTTKTLSDDDIQEKVSEILSPVIAMDGISIPGM